MGRINVTIRIFAGTLVPNLGANAASPDYGREGKLFSASKAEPIICVLGAPRYHNFEQA